MYTGDQIPEPLPSEQSPYEQPMGDAIKVVGCKPWNTMDPMSRVNFVKIYTVEHNVKVEEFGKVDSADEWKLISQFHSHWGIPRGKPLPTTSRHKTYTHTPSRAPGPSQIPRTHSGSGSRGTSNLSSMSAINGHTSYCHSSSSKHTQANGNHEQISRSSGHRQTNPHKSPQSHGKRRAS